MTLFLVSVAIGVVIGLAFAYFTRIRIKVRAPKYFAACEYWVYQTSEVLPDQDKVMTSMVARNPHARGGQSPIGPREGILFSDIRLNVTIVLRSKNPHVFRPDVFSDVEAGADILEAMASAKSLVKLRYVSEEPLTDNRHLQFMPHLAAAYARLAGAKVIFDVVAERLYTAEEFEELLGGDIDSTRSDVHLRVLWKHGEMGAHAETKGLLKKGMQEMTTADAPTDNQRLVCDVLQEAASSAWDRGEHLDTEVVEYFGDRFEVRLFPADGEKRHVHIVRFQSS